MLNLKHSNIEPEACEEALPCHEPLSTSDCMLRVHCCAANYLAQMIQCN